MHRFGAFAGVAIVAIAGFAFVKGTGSSDSAYSAPAAAEEGKVAPRALPKTPVHHNAL